MSRFKRMIVQDNCCTDPVCVACSPSGCDAEIVLSSQKLACRDGLAVITVLFVVNDILVHQAVVEPPSSRISLPARLLSVCSTITLHLVIGDANGIDEVIDSGQLLVLPCEATKEVQSMFQYMIQDVQDTFYSHILSAPDNPTADAPPGRGNSQSRVILGPAEDCKAAIYAYQHLFLPVEQLIATVLQGAATHDDMTSTSRDAANLHSMGNYLLNFLVDNDMYQTAMYIMSQLPFSPEEAMGSRRQVPNTLPGSNHRVSLLPQSLQQQLLTIHIAQQQTAESLQELMQRSRALSILDLQEQQFDGLHAALQPATGTTVHQQSSDASVASANDILRQLRELEQARLEQGALECELLLSQQQLSVRQQQQELAAGPSPSIFDQSAAVTLAAGELHRCNSVPWNLHSQQQPPGSTFAPPTNNPANTQQHSNSMSSDGQELFLDTTQFNSLGFKQAQPLRRRSTISLNEVEGYLQPHRCLSRRLVPAAAEEARKPSASIVQPVQQAVARKPATVGLAVSDTIQPLVPILQALARGSTQVNAQRYQQQQGETDEPIATVGSAVAAASDQCLHLQLKLQEVDWCPIPTPLTAVQPRALEQPCHDSQHPKQPYLAVSLQHPALQYSILNQELQAPSAAQPRRLNSAGLWHFAAEMPASATDTLVAAAQMLPTVAEVPGGRLALVNKQPIPQFLDCVCSSHQEILSGDMPQIGLQTPLNNRSVVHDSLTSSNASPAAYHQATITQAASDVASSSSCKPQQVQVADAHLHQSRAVMRSAKQQAAGGEVMKQDKQACCSASCSSTSSSRPAQAAKSADGVGARVHGMRSLVGAALSGFNDAHMEKSYVMFKNHSSSLVDGTAAVLCFGMLIASANRTWLLKESQCAEKLMILAVYGLAFFFPYAVMQVKPQLYLRYREPLLMWARVLSSMVLVSIGVFSLPMPEAWAAAVFKSRALFLQDGFILPCCQQVRPRAVAVVAVAQCMADAALLQRRYTPLLALLQSIGMGIFAVLIGTWLDVWCRKQFMVQYKGLFRSG